LTIIRINFLKIFKEINDKNCYIIEIMSENKQTSGFPTAKDTCAYEEIKKEINPYRANN